MATKPLSETHPALAAEWHPTLNGDKTPDKFTAGSHKRIWWLGKCGHIWDTDLSSRTYSKSGCPYCSGKSVLVGHNDLATTHPALAAEWHPTKNGDLTPEKKSAGSNDPVWWLGKCGHEWRTWIAGRAIHKTGCSVCGGKIIVVGVNDLESQFTKIASEWHPTKNGDLTPDRVFAKSGNKYWWLGKCGHEWQAQVMNRTFSNTGCGFCSGNNLEIGKSDLKTLRPDLASEFHPTKNKTLSPENFAAKSDQIVWWLGKCGHEWRTSIKHRNLSESGCPKCSQTGFSSVDPGILYFIHNPKLLAFKVGITNQGVKTDRLKHFRRLGWVVLKTWENESGQIIIETETKLFRWLRKDLGIPAMLDKKTMGTPQGASETFSDSILTQAEVIAKIEELLAQFEG